MIERYPKRVYPRYPKKAYPKLERYVHRKVTHNVPIKMRESHFRRIVRGIPPTRKEIRIQKDLHKTIVQRRQEEAWRTPRRNLARDLKPVQRRLEKMWRVVKRRF